ncbi:MAG: flagellar basal-body MS-ring/collar protein FliF [Pseudomonadota bacterium]
MKNLIERVKSLSSRQRFIAAGGLVTVLFVLVLMLHMMTASKMALLYSGLDDAAAGEVITALESDAVAYEVRGRSIYVDAAARDQMRLRLAAQNLPSPTSQGYELLDNLDGFSTTSEMFSVTYWRAKEGELARTLMSMPGIKTARVHLGVESRSAFTRRDRQRTASVAVTAPMGLDDSQVEAIRYLTALSVPGLEANEVAVIDSARGLLSSSDTLASLDDGRRAEALERDLLSLLEARVGAGNARVNVAIDIGRQREEIQERAIDPDSAVVTESVRENTRSREQGQDQAVTIASDLPDGEDATTERTRENEESREEVSYAVSSTDRRIERLPGGIDRISVAVLINEARDEEGNVIPRATEEIAIFEALIAAAAGIDEARGDTVIVRSLPFDPLPTPTEAPAPSLQDRLFESSLIEIVTLGVFLLLFGLLVLKPMFSSRGADEVPLLVTDALGLPTEGPAKGEPGSLFAPADDPRLLLRDRSSERQEDAATLLNAWLDEKEDAA